MTIKQSEPTIHCNGWLSPSTRCVEKVTGFEQAIAKNWGTAGIDMFLRPEQPLVATKHYCVSCFMRIFKK